MKASFRKKTFLITGANGFLGNALFLKLKELGCKKVIPIKRTQYDLTSENMVKKMYSKYKPNIVFHLAASVGGIGINKKNPGKFFYENSLMNLHVIHHAYLNKIDKIISAGSVSSYPKNAKLPFKEENLWNGYPEEISSSYGIAKRLIHSHSLSYKKQYKFNSILLLFTNLYGPNDNFNINSSHVIASLIKKFYLGKSENKKFVNVWGDGSNTRDFCYVDDAVRGLILTAKKYKKIEPLNIASGKETSIRNLAKIISKTIGFKGKIKWQKNKPRGIKRRFLSASKAKKEIGFKTKVSLQEGLRKTINWYISNKNR